MQKDIAIFNRVFSKMPDEFTSFQLSDRMKTAGVTGQIIANQNILLHFLCEPLNDNLCKTWRKKGAMTLIPAAEKEVIMREPTEQECIDFLKSTGKYKISRVTWEEV